MSLRDAFVPAAPFPGLPGTGAGGVTLRVPALAAALAVSGFILMAGWGLRRTRRA